MKKSKNILILLLILVLVLSASLVACNKRGQNDAKRMRATQANRVEQIVLSGINEKWDSNLSDSAVATLDNAGDYIVTKGWTSLVCDVVKDSSLQTAKIKTLADTLESDDGKKLLKEFSQNAELLVPMLKKIGLTASDVSSLAYDLISKLISDGRSTVSGIVTRLDDIKEIMRTSGASAQAIENVNTNRAILNLAQQSLNATDEQKQGMQNALSDAKNAMGELIAFAYDTSVNTLTDELYSKLFVQDGALSNVSPSELATLVNALLGNVTRLKNALTQEEIKKLDTALDLFIDNFDNKSISSTLYSQIITYAKYAYMAVDVIPSLCEVAIASESVLSSSDFINDFLKQAKLEKDKTLDDTTSSLNKVILSARIIDGVMQSGRFDQEGINALIERVCKQGTEGYQKAMPLIVLDLLLNFSDIVAKIETDKFVPSHPDIISQDMFTTMLGALLFNLNVEKMKQAYYDFELNPTQKNLTALYNIANFTIIEGLLGVDCPYPRPAEPTEETMPYIKQWYNWQIGKIGDVSDKIAACIPSVKADLKAFVGDYYVEGSKSAAAIKTIAQWSLFEKDVDEKTMETEYMPILLDSKILGAALIFGF